MNIVDMLDDSNNAIYEAIDSSGQVIDSATAKQLRSDALHVTERLLSVAKPGDRILIPPLSGIDFERAFFGIIAAGMIAVPLPKMPKVRSKKFDRIEKVIKNCSPKIIIGDIDSQRIMSTLYNLTVVPVTQRGTKDLADTRFLAKRSSEEPVLLQYTSGSTSSPKGVEVSQSNLIYNQRDMSRRCGVKKGTDIVAWLPSFHDMGLCSMTIMPAVSGARLVRIATNDFIRRPLLWLEAMCGRDDVWSAAPDFSYRTCVRAMKLVKEFSTDLSGWHFAGNAAEPVRESTMQEFEKTFAPYGFNRQAFHPGYGLAESTVCVSVNAPDVSRRSLRLNPVQLAAGLVQPANPGELGVEVSVCGKPIDSSHVVVLELDDAVPTNESHIGELCVAGPSNARGYWKDAGATEETFGTLFKGRRYLRTGDLGFLSEGEVVICGRKKDLLIHAGENFFAPDIEAAGQDGLNMEGVPIMACFQMSDGLVYFCYETTQGLNVEEETRNCSRALAKIATLYPGTVQVVAVRRGQIPRTTSGKVQRRLAAKMMAQGEFRIIASSPVPNGGRT